MASFTDIYKQELKGKGVLSSLGSAALKRTKERLDPRNMLFGGGGILSATGQKIFGKGYSAINKSSVGSKIASGGEIKSEAINSLLISSQRQEAQLTIIAKNTMNSNSMARDINVMRQNIMKLVTLNGGKASRSADMFFKDKAARESAYESQFSKITGKGSTSPVPVTQKKEDGAGGGIFGPLLSLGGTIIGAIKGALSGLGTIVLEGLSKIFTIDNLMKALGFAKEGLSAIFTLAMKVATNPLFLALAGITATAGILSFMRSDYDARKEEYLGLAKKKKEGGLSADEESRLKELDNPALRSEATKQLKYDPIEGREREEKTSKQIGAENARKSISGRWTGTQYETSEEKASRASANFAATDPRRLDLSPTREIDSGKKQLLDFIGQKESGALGYNALVYGKGTPTTADLTNMTLEEVMNYQSGMIARGHASTAVGRYQFTKATLQEFAKKAGINASEKFTPEIQDKIAGALLDEVGYEKVVSGKMSMDEFQNRLAGRWASLPRNDNTSQYAGMNGNKILTSSDTLRNVISTSMAGTTGTALASASTTSSDLKMAAAAPQMSAPVTVASTTNVNNSQAIVANRAQVFDNAMQTALAIL